MRLIQVNVEAGKLGNNLVNFLKSEDPDVVCMQEAIDIEGTNGYFTGIGEIQGHLAFPHCFKAPVCSFKFMGRELEMSNTILSKRPLDNQLATFTNLEFKKDYDYIVDDYNIRNLQYATFKVGDKIINLFNHHGYHVKNPIGDELSIAGMQKVVAAVKAVSGPTILTGDFNISPESPALKPLDGLLTNLTAEYGLKNTLSAIHKLAGKVEIACDYIFVSDDIKVQSFKVADELVSDHKALILEFEV